MARAIIADVRSRLPGLEWEAWWGSGSSYPELYRRRIADPGAFGSIDGWAELNEHTAALTCYGCRAEVALPSLEPVAPSSASPSRSGRSPLGADCDARVRQDALDARRAAEGGRRRLQNFEELAGLRVRDDAELVGRSDSANHLATVVADGNRVGWFFEALRTKVGAPAGSDPGTASEKARMAGASAVADAAKALDAASRAAVDEAIGRTLEVGGSRGPELHAHFVGGDDIFITVPARAAWRFVTALGEAFDILLEHGLAKAGIPDDLLAKRPTLGIGVAFGHISHPVSLGHENAEKALRTAKTSVAGSACAVSWVDLTEDRRVSAGRFISLDDLRAQLGGHAVGIRTAVLDMGRSRRSALARSLRGALPPSDLLNEVRDWAERVHSTAVTEAIDLDLKNKREPGEIVEELGAAVSLARWWPGSAQDDLYRGSEGAGE